MTRQSRGLRNHNPLNIRKSAAHWQGMADKQNDREFVTFISNAYGYRAAFKTLYTYMTCYHLCTIRDIIHRWAPASENDTKMYIRTVTERSSVGELVKLYWTNKEDMVKVVMAMAYVENGTPAIKSEVEEGYMLAFGF